MTTNTSANTRKLLGILPGCRDHEHADWEIGPVGVTRDSDLIAESNWEVTIARFAEIDPEGLDHEVHRFGHWACGWIEELAYRPGSAVAVAAESIRSSLDGYAILDEMHLGALEMEALDEAWPDIVHDMRRSIARAHPEIADDISDDDVISDAALSEAMRDKGEIEDGYQRFSARDVEAITDLLFADASDDDEKGGTD